MKMHVSKSSNNNGSEGGRYLNKNCKCGKRAGIRISETEENKNRLFYYCKDGRCGSFIGWCIPATSCRSSFSNGSMDSRMRSRERATSEEVQVVKEEIEVLKTENMVMVEKMKAVEVALGYMKAALGMAIFFNISVFTVIMCLVIMKF